MGAFAKCNKYYILRRWWILCLRRSNTAKSAVARNIVPSIMSVVYGRFPMDGMNHKGLNMITTSPAVIIQCTDVLIFTTYASVY